MPYPQYSEAFDFTTLDLATDANWDVYTASTYSVEVDGDAAKASVGSTFKGYACILQTSLDGVNQCVAMEIKNASPNDNSYGAIFRSSAIDGSGSLYSLTIRWSGSVFQFSVERYAAGLSFGELIGSRINITTPDNGDWIGFSVEGIGDSTVFKYWDFGASEPGEYSTWGTATQENTANPTTALDTGSYCGLWLYYTNAVSTQEIDTWKGGDTAAAAAAALPMAQDTYYRRRSA